MTVIDLRGGNVVGVEQYEFATGKRKRKRSTGLWGLITKAQADQSERRKIRVQSKADARVGRAEAKKGQALAQQLQADASKESVKGDVAVAKALNDSPSLGASSPSDSGGLSTTTKYAIGGVALVVLLGVGFMIYKRSNP
jgi:hypothetical protein